MKLTKTEHEHMQEGIRRASEIEPIAAVLISSTATRSDLAGIVAAVLLHNPDPVDSAYRLVNIIECVHSGERFEVG